MKSYISYFKLRFITALQYRTAALAGMSTQLFFGLIFVLLYEAFYSANANISISYSKTVNYLWLNQALLALINQMTVDSELTSMIVKGDLAYEFIRPKDLYFMWYFKTLGNRLAAVILRSIPLFLVAIFLLPKPYNLTGPENLTYFLFFLLSLSFGTILVCALSLLSPIICMKTLNEKGFISIYIILSNLFSGLDIPLYLFPEWLERISNLLPFRYVSDIPFQLYNGTISYHEGVVGIGIQFIWIFIIIIISRLIMSKLLKKVVVQGG